MPTTSVYIYIVNRGLDKSRFQNHSNFSLYCFCGMNSFFFFFRVVKDGKFKTTSVVCSEECTSHTAHPPPVGASSQWVTCVYDVGRKR